MTLSQGQIDKQARQFTYYLIKKEPIKLEIDLYCQAIANSKDNISLREKKVFDFVDRHNWSIGLIDSSMALTDSHSAMRRRLFIMFSILECMPERYDQFIPKRHSLWYWFSIFYICLTSILKAACGSVLLKTLN